MAELYYYALDMFSIRSATAGVILSCIWTFHTASTWAAIEIPLGGATIEDGKLGAVASESKICSHIGTDLLKAGGNAADAVRFWESGMLEKKC